ncbi:MAG: hypothetical protein Kow00124_04330 [Anaerolineae bacterium]
MLKSLIKSWRLGPQHLLWLAIPPLLWWALRTVPLGEIGPLLSRIGPWQIAALLAINIAVMLSFSGRWWFILRGQGQPIGWLRLASYRLAAFGISYFTPGPQFGGEPFQVYALMHRHGAPGTSSAASVALDKLLEMVVNFTIVSAGVVITLQANVLANRTGGAALIPAMLLLAIPVAYLIAAWRGRHPLAWMLGLLPARYRQREWYQRTRRAIRESEHEAGELIRRQPASLILATFISLVSWAGQMLEYWLAARFLGLTLSPLQLISIMTMAYIAFLTPLPGGLGALEAGQVYILQALRLAPEAGLGIALIIRVRDILFGGIGLWLAGVVLKR